MAKSRSKLFSVLSAAALGVLCATVIAASTPQHGTNDAAASLSPLHHSKGGGKGGGSSKGAAVAQGTFVESQPQNYDRVIALSDAHGMYAHLLTLLTAAQLIDSNLNWTAGKTLLVIIGDSIDKGPQSLEILDLWISLQAQAPAAGGKLVHLLGNHEAEFLSDPTDDSKAAELNTELKSKNIPLSDLTSTTTPHGAFLHSEPVAAKIGTWLFCHAGLFPAVSWSAFQAQATTVLANQDYGNDFLIGDNSLLEAKEWWANDATRQQLESQLAAQGITGVVFGHQPDAFYIEGRIAEIDGGKLVKIDNGMAPQSGGNPGSILVFSSPSLMNLSTPPALSVIEATGVAHSIQPEGLAPAIPPELRHDD